MKPKPKPVTGAFFGFLLGVVVVALLWQLGVVPPDRLVVFGIVAIAMLLGTFVLTQRVSLVRKRFVFVVLLAALLGGVALTGIPEFVGGGSISEGCTIEASSSLSGVTTPADTSATSPFQVAVTDDVPFKATTQTLLTTGTNAVGMRIAGFPIPMWTSEVTNPNNSLVFEGMENVQEIQDRVQEVSGLEFLELTGTYHAYGYVHAQEGDCDTQGYVKLSPAGAFATPLLIALWVLTGLLFIIILALAISVRRSIRRSERLATTIPPEAAMDATWTDAPVPVPDATPGDSNPSTPADSNPSTPAVEPATEGEPAQGSETVPDSAEGAQPDLASGSETASAAESTEKLDGSDQHTPKREDEV